MSSTQVRSNGAYAPLGANYADDDAIATLDLEENDRAELLYLRGLAYCARDPRTEGYISDIALRAGKVLRRTSVKKRTKTNTTVTDSVQVAAEVLVQVGLWTREGDGYRISAWLKWNKSWSEISKKRAQDRARKGGTGEESDPTPPGSHAESTRKPHGVAAPRQIHGSTDTRQGSSSTRQGVAADGDQPPRSSGHEKHLLDVHQADLGPLPTITANALGKHLATATSEGTPDDVLLTALAEWRRRPDAKPGLLPHLIGDAARRPTAPDPDDPLAGLDPDARAWVEEQQAARQAAATR